MEIFNPAEIAEQLLLDKSMADIFRDKLLCHLNECTRCIILPGYLNDRNYKQFVKQFIKLLHSATPTGSGDTRRINSYKVKNNNFIYNFIIFYTDSAHRDMHIVANLVDSVLATYYAGIMARDAG